MKERHKRKEVYSFIIVSHTDNQSRQLLLSAAMLRFVVCLLVLCGLGLGLMIYWLSASAYREYELKAKVDEGQQRVAALEEENARLSSDYDAINAEYTQLKASLEAEKEEEEAKAIETTLPRLYPSDGVGELKTTFSEQKPYLTIGMHKGDNVVATGDGVVRLIDYDEGYVHSIEIEHINGYISRYLCNKEVEIKVSEGDEVKARDALFTITRDFTELDYQIILNNEALNPFQVMKLEE
ncbi:MAG: M23 family metallopeptidase [Lachnospiraceae bacterium]|nr:M23 family metallopeptidase [Lachnospiraceae bacterium]